MESCGIHAQLFLRTAGQRAASGIKVNCHVDVLYGAEQRVDHTRAQRAPAACAGKGRGPLGVAHGPAAIYDPPLIDKIFWETKQAA